GAFVPSAREFYKFYGLDEHKLKYAKTDPLVMHPGPMNRGVEMMFDTSSKTQREIIDHVTHGISVRMAVLFELLASGDEVPS
ncbi:MAG: aspartate carbamoyltransferase catalytic subunit, partial [Ilumatobacteraceae bacterium]